MNDALSSNSRRHSPGQITDPRTSRRIPNMGDGRWNPTIAQRYKTLPSLVEAPVRAHIIVLSRNGLHELEEPFEDQRTSSQWAQAGHIHVTPAGTSVTRHPNELPDVILLHIKSDLIEDVEKSTYGNLCDLSLLPSRLAFHNDQMNLLADSLLLEQGNEDAWEHGTLSSLLVRCLIVHILRHYRHDHPLSAVKQMSLTEPRIARVLAFMTKNFADKITAHQLATISGASRSSFSRLFREAVGQSAYQHLTAIRLEHALRLLEQTAISITEIAFESGFGQPTHFTTVFRERFGVSPRAWRNANAAAKSSI